MKEAFQMIVSDKDLNEILTRGIHEMAAAPITKLIRPDDVVAKLQRRNGRWVIHLSKKEAK